MAAIKKHNGSTWETTTARKYETATETIQSGDTIYADGTAATVSLKGNTIQSGTPTPDNPIMPQGTGERTGNLAYGRIDDVNIVSSGTITRDDRYDVAIGHVESGIVYTANSYVVAFYTNEPTTGSVSYDGSRIVATTEGPVTFTAPITGYVAFRLHSGEQAMLNSGSTALPYEPYGYKIPISNGSTTTPIYLGSTASIRQIQKLVLTGQENDWIYQSDYTRFLLTVSDVKQFVVRTAPMYSTHYQVIDDGRPIADVPNNSVYFNNQYLCITTSDYTSTTDFKAFLAAQYSAGTPVEVYYILETATTAAVNEPLMKIGDYADTLSNATAIPTTDGANSITVDTTVQPSEFTATWTGWHDSSVKEYDGSDWN